MSKFCSKCKTKKPSRAFFKDESRKDGLYCFCNTCESRRKKTWYFKYKEVSIAKTMAWRKQHPKRYKAIRLKYSFGITIQEFYALRKAQKNRCAICRKRFYKTPSVDHNHRTGVVRGLLCNACNVGMGFFKDSHSSLLAASKYLKGKEKGKY